MFLRPEGGKAVTPEAIRRTAEIIWWAMLASLAVAVGLAYLLYSRTLSGAGHAPIVPHYPARLAWPFWLAAASNIYFAYKLDTRQQKRIETRLSEELEDSNPLPERDLRISMYTGVVATVIGLAALGETIGFYGLILAILGVPPRSWLPFFFLAFLHLLFYKSRRDSYFQSADERVREILAGYTHRQS